MEELIPFLIAAAYLVVRFMRRDRGASRPAAAPRPERRPRAASTAGPTPFEQLLARLEQEAAGGPAVVPEARLAPALAEPPPVHTPGARRLDNAMFAESRAAAARDQAQAADATAFRSLESTRPETARDFSDARGFETEARGFEHDRHGFGADNPTSEVAFSRARDADRRLANANRTGGDPHGLAPASAPATAPRVGSPEAIRAAFVLSTVLDRRPPLRRPSQPTRRPAAREQDGGG